jgi:hypothetical protein
MDARESPQTDAIVDIATLMKFQRHSSIPLLIELFTDVG